MSSILEQILDGFRDDVYLPESTKKYFMKNLHNKDVLQNFVCLILLGENNMIWKLKEKNVVDGIQLHQIYHFFSIYRIRCYYLLLNKKISLLDSITKHHKEKGIHFKKFFGYHELVEEQSKMKNCLTICLELHHLLCFLKFIIYYWASKIMNNLPKIGIINNITKLDIFQFFHYFEPLNKSIPSRIKKLLKQMVKTESLVKLCTIYLKMDTIIQKIMEKNDPHHVCEYFITFGDYLVPHGLMNVESVSCDDDISLFWENETWDPEFLMKITENDFVDFFKPSFLENAGSYFIHLHNKNQTMYINYHQENPSFVKVVNVPKNTFGVMGYPKN